MFLSFLLLGRYEKFGEIFNELYNSPCYSFVKPSSNKHLSDRLILYSYISADKISAYPERYIIYVR